MASCSDAGCVPEVSSWEKMTLFVKWSGKEYTVRVCADDTIGELKRRICEVTNVLPKRQKLLYPKLPAPKLSNDATILSTLQFKPTIKMTMIGTLEDEIIVDQVDDPEIIDDFELAQDDVTDIKDKEVNKQKLRHRISQYKCIHKNHSRFLWRIYDIENLLEGFLPLWPSDLDSYLSHKCYVIQLRNPCREGKKLLVLDIDYTLFDHRSTAENPLELMRPYLHEFLSAVYSEYDIMIWSATSMKWVELKMGQLGVLDNPNYKITALLDHMAMITVQSDSRGIFDCKPLGLIWALFPQYYDSKNTIMFDDLRRNFVMNPQNGLTIKPFRKAHLHRNSDDELVRLTQYLLAVADLEDLNHLDHGKWESFTEKSKRQRHG